MYLNRYAGKYVEMYRNSVQGKDRQMVIAGIIMVRVFFLSSLFVLCLCKNSVNWYYGQRDYESQENTRKGEMKHDH